MMRKYKEEAVVEMVVAHLLEEPIAKKLCWFIEHDKKNGHPILSCLFDGNRSKNQKKE